MSDQIGRKQFVRDHVQLDPQSLVGSWFHRLEDDVIVWQGVIVGEPQAGVYLAEIETEAVGSRNVQRLLTMDRLTADDDANAFRFYDTEQLARGAYAEWVSTTNQRI